MLERHLGEQLKRLASGFPVITLTGPRQSGKTTLARSTFQTFDYVSLEDPKTRAYALQDPRGFLGRFDGPVIIDEAQHAPDLFSYIQGIVDDRGFDALTKGRAFEGVQFVLTGSQHFLLLERITQSLAGRAAITHLFPLSLAELCGRPQPVPGDLGTPFSESVQPPHPLFEYLFSGFFPDVQTRGVPPGEWYANYYETYLKRDVRTVLNVGDLEAFDRFVRLCAGRSGQLVDLSGLGADCGVSHTTARRWLSVLEASFVIGRLAPYHRNYGKRLVKRPKIHFLDPGLLCFLLDIRSPDDLHYHGSRGAIFETFVYAELRKNLAHTGHTGDLYFWRDHRGVEVDFLLRTGGGLVGLEAKSGQTVMPDAYEPLMKWRELAGDEVIGTGMVHGGEQCSTFKGIALHPWYVL